MGSSQRVRSKGYQFIPGFAEEFQRTYTPTLFICRRRVNTQLFGANLSEGMSMNSSGGLIVVGLKCFSPHGDQVRSTPG